MDMGFLRQSKDWPGYSNYSYPKGSRAMRNPVLSPDITIAALLRRWPRTISVLLRHHMACVGCAMSTFDTLRDVADIYNLPFERFLAEIRDATEDGGPRTNDG
jgi:hybrid cluster-associated redox disulfide protein